MIDVTELLLVGKLDGVLQKLHRSIDRQEPNWTIVHCPDSDTALTYLKRRPAKLVLACLEAIPVSNEAFFENVMKSAPSAIRIALSESESPPLKVPHAHQCLATREDLTYLHPILSAAADVAAKCARHGELMKIISRLIDVPSPPSLYFNIREQLASSTSSVAGMAEIAARDPGLVARILRIANSGFYALPRSVGDLTTAIGLIGTDALLGLVLTAHLFAGLPPPGLKLDLLWHHTFRVSELARQITRSEGGDRHAESQSAVAGLLHDIGLMVLFENEAARYQPMWQQSGGDESVLAQMEYETFGFTHGELGALILMLWCVPEEIVDAVANSHAPAGVLSIPKQPLTLTSRSVLAAEWLVNREHREGTDDIPAELAGTSEASLASWVMHAKTSSQSSLSNSS